MLPCRARPRPEPDWLEVLGGSWPEAEPIELVHDAPPGRHGLQPSAVTVPVGHGEEGGDFVEVDAEVALSATSVNGWAPAGQPSRLRWGRGVKPDA